MGYKKTDRSGWTAEEPVWVVNLRNKGYTVWCTALPDTEEPAWGVDSDVPSRGIHAVVCQDSVTNNLWIHYKGTGIRQHFTFTGWSGEDVRNWLYHYLQQGDSHIRDPYRAAEEFKSAVGEILRNAADLLAKKMISQAMFDKVSQVVGGLEMPVVDIRKGVRE